MAPANARRWWLPGWHSHGFAALAWACRTALMAVGGGSQFHIAARPRQRFKLGPAPAPRANFRIPIRRFQEKRSVGGQRTFRVSTLGWVGVRPMTPQHLPVTDDAQRRFGICRCGILNHLELGRRAAASLRQEIRAVRRIYSIGICSGSGEQSR
jgi:hypothetical protein